MRKLSVNDRMYEIIQTMQHMINAHENKEPISEIKTTINEIQRQLTLLNMDILFEEVFNV